MRKECLFPIDPFTRMFMNGDTNRTKAPLEKSTIVYWQLVWFFSMEESAQEALLGSTEEQWFIEENEDNRGANYLIGLCHALNEGYRPFNPLADEFWAAVLAVSQHFEPQYWIFKSLSQSPEWIRARTLAAQLLPSENIQIHPPRKPFVIEDLIRVDHWVHASKIRGKPRGWPVKS